MTLSMVLLHMKSAPVVADGTAISHASVDLDQHPKASELFLSIYIRHESSPMLWLVGADLEPASKRQLAHAIHIGKAHPDASAGTEHVTPQPESSNPIQQDVVADQRASAELAQPPSDTSKTERLPDNNAILWEPLVFRVGYRHCLACL